eukprot:GGOE01008927.1.p1 GENE.GGOE01008927.1~~GGOE01008927.1.p1  ORF type:complete len:382 (-),score=82.01 GGOE01008927.1:456-1580(-)
MGNSNGNGIFLDLTTGRSGAGRYQPGETVSGVAHLHIEKELTMRGVMLKVSGVETASGRQKVDRRSRATARRSRFIVASAATHDPSLIMVAATTGTSGTACSTFNSRSQRHEHFKVTVPLMEPTAQGKLEVGQYSIPFSFTLPVDCPPSFSLSGDNWNCAVEYKVKAVCKLAGCKSDLKDTRIFSVTGVMPLNPGQLELHDRKKVPQFCFLGNAGQLQLDLNLQRNVWFAGDRVECSGTIANESTKAVDAIKFRVFRVIDIHQRKRGRAIVTDVSESTFPGVAANERRENLQLTLSLPTNLVPSCHGRTFEVRYVLSVECNVPWAKNPVTSSEIVVCAAQGTAPSPLPPQPTMPAKWQPEILQPVVVPALVCAV